MLKEYLRSISKQSMFCGTEIFKGYPELWITNVEDRFLIFEKRVENSVKVWKSDDEKSYRLPADLGFANSYVVITELSEGIWDMRRADQQEIDANKRKRISGNVGGNNYLYLSKENGDRLHWGEKNWYIQLVCINNELEGSYIVLKPLYSKTDISEHSKATNTEAPRFSFVMKVRKNNRCFHLPLSFAKMTGIRDDSVIPVWQRDDGAVVIEGRPGICKKCGAHISRYKRPMTDHCSKCGRVQSLTEVRFKEYYRAIMALK